VGCRFLQLSKYKAVTAKFYSLPKTGGGAQSIFFKTIKRFRFEKNVSLQPPP
jgi:hypothetical protein